MGSAGIQLPPCSGGRHPNRREDGEGPPRAQSLSKDHYKDLFSLGLGLEPTQ